jgi:predicted ATPase
VIISTQSVSMVNQFRPEELIVVDQEKDESVFKRLSSKELEYWLEDYSLGEIWEMNLIGGRPRR